MPFLSKMLSFWRNLFRRNQIEQDLNDELQSYVEELAERKMQAGLDPEAAREAALTELGGMDRIKHLVRQQRVAFGGLRGLAIGSIVAVAAFVCGALSATAIQRQPVAQGPAKAKSETRRSVVLEGRLVDDKTGQPIPGIELGLEQPPPMRRLTHTDEDGRFSFSNPPSQGYWLTAGDQKWDVGGRFMFGPFGGFDSSDNFLLDSPTSLSVLNKEGQRQEGDPLIWNGTEVLKNSKRKPPEIRRFHYSNSLLELRAESLNPGAHGNKPDVSFTLGAVYLPGEIPGDRTPAEVWPSR